MGDAGVVRLLFARLLAAHTTGVVVDGFPRTRVQVECVKMLYEKMLQLRAANRGAPRAYLFPKPSFEIVVLYVGEKESVERQLKRGQETLLYNQEVRDTGMGELLEERATDVSEDACRKRYRLFMEQTYDVLQSLKQTFHFHVINAQGDIASVERAIINEFRYQSSLELDEETFDAVRHIPLASEIVISADSVGSGSRSAAKSSGYFNSHRGDRSGLRPAILVQAVTRVAEFTTRTVRRSSGEEDAGRRPQRTRLRATATVEMRGSPRASTLGHADRAHREAAMRFEVHFGFADPPGN